ncbi:hypothetical protein ACNKHL_05415 [Shigella flexneri]
MEIELSRLTEELTSRDRNWQSVPAAWANIIRKTGQTEEPYRCARPGVRGTYRLVRWNSVRLNVNVRESHTMLLDVLSEQHEQHQESV